MVLIWRLWQSKSMAKYDTLTAWLEAKGSVRIRAPFSALDEILDGGLPASAREYEVWWMGEAVVSPTHVQKQGWEAAGYTVESVNLEVGVVTFYRLSTTPVEP